MCYINNNSEAIFLKKTMGTRVREKFALGLSRAVTKLSCFWVYAFSSWKLNG